MSLRLIDKYEVITTLGRGSMGVVYKAQDPEIGRLVAIKTLRSVFLGDDAQGNEALKRFRQESRSAGRLRHPNIVTIFEAGRTENGSPYIVMEFIEGNSLEQIIAQRAPLSPTEALHYLSQVASAIDYAHSQSVIHRDIKPSNVIVDVFYKPHLVDFGVAKLSDTSLTPAGTVVGTPSYMSPEQIRGEQLDSSADLFAFAVMAFELFTAHRPFPGKDFTTVVNNIIHKEPLSFADVGVNLPAKLESVLKRVLAKDKTKRYQSALEFVDKISSVFGIIVDGGGLIGGFRPEEDLSSSAADSLRTVVTAVAANQNPNGNAVFETESEAAIAVPPPSIEAEIGNGSSGPVNQESEDLNRPENIKELSSASNGAEEPKTAVRNKDPRQIGITRKTAVPLSASRLIGGVIVVSLLLGGAFLYLPQSKDVEDEDSDYDEEEYSESESVESVPTKITTASSLDIRSLTQHSSVPSSAEEAISSVVASAVSSSAFTLPVVQTSSVSSLPLSSMVASMVASSGSSFFDDLGTSVASVGLPDLSVITVAQVNSLPELHLAYLLANSSAVPEDVLRAAILEAKTKDDQKFTLLIGALALSGTSLVKVEALRVLGSVPHNARTETREVLKKALSDSDFLVRGFAAKAVGQSGDRSVLPLLEQRLAVENNETVKKILSVSMQALQGSGG